MIYWHAMGSYTLCLPGTMSTNLTKLTINWQNNNYQNIMFYDKYSKYTACGKVYKEHMYYLWCDYLVLKKVKRSPQNNFSERQKR